MVALWTVCWSLGDPIHEGNFSGTSHVLLKIKPKVLSYSVHDIFVQEDDLSFLHFDIRTRLCIREIWKSIEIFCHLLHGNVNFSPILN